jgi:hypothetical protein
MAGPLIKIANFFPIRYQTWPPQAICVDIFNSSPLRGEDFLEINQAETSIVCGGHVC